jgi:hypothetical protein
MDHLHHPWLLACINFQLERAKQTFHLKVINGGEKALATAWIDCLLINEHLPNNNVIMFLLLPLSLSISFAFLLNLTILTHTHHPLHAASNGANSLSENQTGNVIKRAGSEKGS